jgi:translation initiation factor IF-2
MTKRPVRIFQIAKELNISHTEILSFLKDKGANVASHMSPVDEHMYQLILAEFAKDKERVERFRKEQVRREIHDTRVRRVQRAAPKLKLLSLEEQRRIEERERQLELQRAREEKRRREEEARRKAEEEKRRQEEEARRQKETAEEVTKLAKEKKKAVKKAPKEKKRKLRKVDISEIQAQIGQVQRKPKSRREAAREEPLVQQSARDRVRQTLAQLETKSRKKSYKKEKPEKVEEVEVEVEQKPTIQIAEYASVEELSKLFNVSPSNVIQKCFGLGVLATINQRLEWDVIELLAEEFGYTVERITDVGEDIYSLEETEEDLSNAEPRAPVVTVMGHVDHGKTSLLDYIRNTAVVAMEKGGITQHIGAYKVQLDGRGSITFLDTPGHEAFTAMRARGAKVTDIVILVVAADDGVMPQTIEAINHARAANVPIIVAINKIDKTGADPERVKRELSEQNVLVEDWGGKVQCVPVSAKTGEGIDDLLNAILLEAEVLDLKANRKCLCKGTVIDSRLDKGHGPVASVLIQKGTLHVGDPFICHDYPGKVRAIINEWGERLKEAYPSDAVQLLGFEKVPQAADIFAVIEDERELKRIATERQRLRREIDQKRIATHSLDTMSSLIKEGSIRNLPLIIKGDVDGSIEALSETLEKLNTEEVGVNIIHKAVGMITESDVLLAEASKAVIIGFNVQVGSNARLQAKQAGVEIRTYNVIYNALEDIKLALEGLLEPEETEEILGRAVVQAQFKVPKVGFIAGVKVTSGVIVRNKRARLLRDNEVVSEGTITSLKRFKDDVKEVKEGLECGIGIEGVSKYQEGDIIEVFEIVQVKRKLETN